MHMEAHTPQPWKPKFMQRIRELAALAGIIAPIEPPSPEPKVGARRSALEPYPFQVALLMEAGFEAPSDDYADKMTWRHKGSGLRIVMETQCITSRAELVTLIIREARKAGWDARSKEVVETLFTLLTPKSA